MIKIFQVALREFVATVATRAFVLGLILPPALMMITLTVMPRLMNQASPKVTGHIAIIDETGVVAPRVQEAYSAEQLAQRMEKRRNKFDDEDAPQAAKDFARDNPSLVKAAGSNAPQAPTPTLTVRVLPATTTVKSAKDEILATGDKAKDAAGSDPRLVLAVIPAGSIAATGDGTFKPFELYIAPKLDFEVQRDIENQVAHAIVDARIQASGFDSSKIRNLTASPRAEVTSVTADGDKKINEVAKILIPGAFMFLLWISTFTCGQYLLTSTIEEKSSRVMEVILSAVSPMQLLTGKIIGQMGAGLLILLLYCGAGIGGLLIASMMSILPLINLVYLFVYFIIAFCMIASLMAAIGSAVSDIREAQSLLGPVMIVLVIPMMLWFPILRNPNSPFAQVCSFIPPLSPFVMILRLSGSEPVAWWQVPATIVLGCISIWGSLWAAAKVFRVGVLMYGKPPNFRTLIHWIRMA